MNGATLVISVHFAVFFSGLATARTVDCPPFAVRGSPEFQTCNIVACGGEVVAASLCYSTSKCVGDTYLALHDGNRTMLEHNDDYCGLCSSLTYVVPPTSPCKTLHLRQGCFSDYCSGRTAVKVSVPEQQRWDYWFYDAPLNSDSTLLTAWFVNISVWGALSSIQLYAHRRDYLSFVSKISVFKAILVFSLWFMVEFCILCSRLDFFLREEAGAEYRPHSLSNQELVFLTNDFFEATSEELEKFNCAYENIVGAHEHSGRYACSFIYPLGPQLISQEYVKFSIGLQLILIVFLQYACLFGKLFILDRNIAASLSTNFISCFSCTMVELALNFHQFMVLLPLTAVLPNPYCAHVQVPVSTKRAICMFKITAAAFPYGLPSILGGLCLLYMALVSAKSATKNSFLYLPCFLFGSAALYFLATGLCLLIFWSFGGLVLGLWYGVSGFSLGYSTSKTAVILNTMKCSPFLFSLIDIILFPLPVEDEKSIYNLFYRIYFNARSFILKLFSSEPCCIDFTAWVWVHMSAVELWASHACATLLEKIAVCCCCGPTSVQIACDDIEVTSMPPTEEVVI